MGKVVLSHYAMYTKALIVELANRRGDISKGSLINCHAFGLLSIILQENPFIRVFIATPGNTLALKEPGGIPKTIAFHPHHCALDFDIICGELENITLGGVNKDLCNVRNYYFDKYSFESKINGGSGRFKSADKAYWRTVKSNKYKAGDHLHMSASEIHSVACSDKEMTAWLVTEGEEDPNFEPVAYSRNNLEYYTGDGMYLPMTNYYAKELFERIGINI